VLKFSRRLLTVFFDYISAVLSVVLSIAITYDVNKLFISTIGIFLVFFAFPTAYVCFSYFFKVYEVLWELARKIDFLRIPFSSIVSISTLYLAYIAIHQGYTPMLSPVCCIIAFFILSSFSLINRIKKHKSIDSQDKSAEQFGNIMVIGGGSAGGAIIKDIQSNCHKNDCNIKCIIDDDPTKMGCTISGIKIIGGTTDIISAAKKYEIDLIIFAIPTCSNHKKSVILKMCQKTGCKIRVMPSIFKLLEDKDLSFSSLRNVEIEDLLERDPIDIHVDSILDYVSNKVVLVTGGGGSIGSELCRQIAAHKPKQLIIFDIYENNAYEIQNELKRKYPELNLVVLIGSVRDEKRLDGVFAKYQPQLVYHAAAHKHVPLMEDSPNESMKNNVFGTYNTARIARKYGVQRFVLISTDKAVNPTNIMGASKRICEMIIQLFNNNSDTEYVAVRFGNVLGSNGSVIPLFKKQISEGGPVTVTDPNIIRYFMTIPEAVSLVLQAGASANGGEIFVLDMGEPVKIIDLAESLITLSGLKPYEDIQIKFTGLRPGEKLYEEKLLAEEGLTKTENNLIHIAKPIEIDEKLFEETLAKIKVAMADDKKDIRPLVKKIVTTYTY